MSFQVLCRLLEAPNDMDIRCRLEIRQKQDLDNVIQWQNINPAMLSVRKAITTKIVMIIFIIKNVIQGQMTPNFNLNPIHSRL